ncbi:2'-5' RNA ligase family protein [Chengkuizengella axinellae]|uniref:2'-5' RNA ligase family protein n=1 Tax=Chengkuizengella axinellae TaxID=3064388 RepID=A0ABT9J2L2_9BACL|nr:2'-5' RNA ligase family protein [Chengkuizengella sp. 2205SS18-9]MDP5275687.1 2'-5' RNA ligase family protein [Chengkuizengella sp. 2205SS18-9]
MKYFIGIVPPENIKNELIHFQEQWGSKMNIEPHITVKAQGGLTSDGNWLHDIKRVCGDFPSFDLTLREPALFGQSVLYLRVDSNKVHKLHKSLVKAISPSEEMIIQYFELEAYIPHLTIGLTEWGLSEKELSNMKHKAVEQIKLDQTFAVTYVRIYKQDDSNTYDKLIDIPLLK